MNKNKINIEESKPRRGVQTPKKKNKGKHNIKIIKALIYLVLVIFVLSLLFLIGFGIYKLSTSPKYNISNIEFEGNVKYEYDELRAVLEINDNTNLFKLSKKQVINSLKTLPYIEKVKVHKKYPDNLVITITEYDSCYFAYNKKTDKYVKLTQDGVILEECDLELKNENELIIFGINFDDILEKEIVELEKIKLENYTNIKEEYEKVNIGEEITSIEFTEGNVILTLNHNMNVIMNMKDISYKLNFLKSILNEIPGKSGTIDMTVDKPIFRENVK